MWHLYTHPEGISMEPLYIGDAKKFTHKPKKESVFHQLKTRSKKDKSLNSLEIYIGL